MQYTVYILKSNSDGTLYIGQTSNLEDRLLRHNQGRERSTKGKAPYIIIYTEVYLTRSEALRREKLLKSYKGGNALKRLLSLRNNVNK